MPPGGVTEAFSYLRSNPIALVFGLVAIIQNSEDYVAAILERAKTRATTSAVVENIESALKVVARGDIITRKPR